MNSSCTTRNKQFLCREIPLLLAWHVFCGIFKDPSTLLKTLLSQLISSSKGKEWLIHYSKWRCSLLQVRMLLRVCRVMCTSAHCWPSLSGSSSHIGKLQVRKVSNKNKMVVLPESSKMTELRCPFLTKGWSPQQGLWGQGYRCFFSSAAGP